MSNLNITRNTFLEKEELKRLQQFLADDITQKLFVKNTVSFGIVLSDFVGSTDFQIQVGTNVGTIKTTIDSYALDEDGLLIFQKAFDNLSVTDDGVWRWVKISHKYDKFETGVCSVDVSGNLTGVNTLFTEVLRGQQTEVPTKIKFLKTDGTTPINDQIYEVSNLITDISAILTGGSFVAESNLKVIVVGTTPISEFLTPEQEEGLYNYDSCNLQLVVEESVDTPPVIGYDEGKDFYLARVKNSSGTITVQDKRSDWWAFNIPGIGDKMVKSANLSDVTDVVQARANLGVYSKTETDDLVSPWDSGWKAMTRGVGASASNFDMKLRRYGKLCVIQGSFYNGDMTVNNVIASIPYSYFHAIGELPVGVTVQIKSFIGPQLGNNSDNYGLLGYIPTIAQSDGNNLYLKIDSGSYGTSFGSKFSVNMSFFLS